MLAKVHKFKHYFIGAFLLLSNTMGMAQHLKYLPVDPLPAETSLLFLHKIGTEQLAAVDQLHRVSESDMLAGKLIYDPAHVQTKGFTSKISSSAVKYEIVLTEKRNLVVYLESLLLSQNARLRLYEKNEPMSGIELIHQGLKAENGYALGPFQGRHIVLELWKPANDTSWLSIEGAGILFNRDNGFGASDFCEVNVECSEGEMWRGQQRGIARILGREGQNLFWCTGSLINNSRADERKLFLSANHCGFTTTLNEYNLWLFSFDYESITCANPVEEPPFFSLVGADLLAKAINNLDLGSDFKLLELRGTFPENYLPVFNGWDLDETPSESGTCIHHPAGDIKKISTYTEPLTSTRFNSSVPFPDGLYWRVVWSPTENGYGVTEPGSSGAPVFNFQGRIVGILSGGQASCSNTDGPDYYGKINSGWTAKPDSSGQLKYWLDPNQSGVASIDALNTDPNQVMASFSASSHLIRVDEQVVFSSFSSGNINSYLWTFEGGEPASSTDRIPPPVSYRSPGNFDVSLQVFGDNSSDILLLEKLIRVRALIAENPNKGIFTVYTGSESSIVNQWSIYNSQGREQSFEVFEQSEGLYEIVMPAALQGIYILKIRTEQGHESQKFVLLRP